MSENHVLLHIPETEVPSQAGESHQFELDMDTVGDLGSLDQTAYYIQQPDGSKIQISFLADGDIEGGLPPGSTVLGLPVDKSSATGQTEKATEIIATLLNPESSPHMSAVQSSDGQIYYLESYVVDNADNSAEQPRVGSASQSESASPPPSKSKGQPGRDSSVRVMDKELGVEDRMTMMNFMVPRIPLRKTLYIARNNNDKARKISTLSTRACDINEAPNKPVPCSVPTRYNSTAGRLSVLRNNEANKNKSVARNNNDKARKKSKLRDNDGDALYKCDMCAASFPRATQLYGHASAHTGERTLRCTFCADSKVFSAHGALSLHERTCHTSVRRHKCAVCAASFDRESQLDYHRRRVHMEERSHMCVICKKAFFKRSDLKCHVNIHLQLDNKVCPTCGRVFNHVSNLNRHLRVHSGVKPYPCMECGRRFSQAGTLAYHQRTHMPQVNVCTLCDQNFRTRPHLNNHLKEIHGVDQVLSISNNPGAPRKYYCRVCGMVFPFATLLKSHQSEHTKQSQFRCSGCNQDSATMEGLLTHACLTPRQRANAMEAQLQNLLTGLKLCRAPDQTKMIVLVNPPGMQDPCVSTSPRQPKQVGDLAQLEGGGVLAFELEGGEQVLVEMKQVKEVDEDEAVSPAPVNTVEPDSLLNNDLTPASDEDETSREMDPELREPPEQCDGDKPPDYAAPPSIEEFVRPVPTEDTPMLNETPGMSNETSVKNKHLVANTPVTDGTLAKPNKGDEPQDIPSNIVVEIEIQMEPCAKIYPPVKVFRCEICKKTFSKKTNYKQHLGTHFADKKMFPCPSCDQSFAWKSTLNKHTLKFHQSEQRTKYICELCGREYLLQSQVQEHVKRDHEMKRPHTCLTCQKQFFRKHDLTIHERTHTGVKPYICRVCGKGFTHASHIIRHEHAHAGNKRYTCNKCGKLFSQSTSLKVHQKHPARCIPAREKPG